MEQNDLEGLEPIRSYKLNVYAEVDDEGNEAASIEPGNQPGLVVVDLLNMLESMLSSCGLHQSANMIHTFPAVLIAEQRANAEWKMRNN